MGLTIPKLTGKQFLYAVVAVVVALVVAFVAAGAWGCKLSISADNLGFICEDEGK